MRLNRWPVFLGLLLALPMGASQLLAAIAEGPNQEAVFLPGGIADPDHKTGFVANSSGGIDAIALETGRSLWETKAASRPLVAFQHMLVAQTEVKYKANTLQIVVLDANDKGKQLMESEPVVFPDWVSVGLAYGRSFTSEGNIDSGNLLLKWEARAWYAGGAPPTRETEARARKEASGLARIDLKSGQVQMLDPDKVQGTGLKLPEELKTVSHRLYWTGLSWENKPLILGNKVAVLSEELVNKEERRNKQKKLILKTWDLAAGKASETMELMRGEALWPEVQPDGRYIFVHEGLLKKALPEGDYAWWVFSVATGKQVAKLPFEAGTEALAVIGPRLYYVMAETVKAGIDPPRILKAVDLGTGKQAWERVTEPRRTLPPLP